MSDIIKQKGRSEDGLPAFFIEKLLKEYGEECERILEGFVRRPVTLRVNRLKTERAAVERVLSALGISTRRVAWYADALIVENARERTLEETELYQRGEIYLQSLSSMLPPLLVKPQAGESVFDMTAAPGGKTAQLSALSGGQALITACEKDKIRFERLAFNLRRQGVPRVNAMQTDAIKLDEFFRFDKILLDAPCSGSGTVIAGEPVRLSEKLLSACVRAQTALLEKGLKLLKKGGTLVYSTCSILKEENEEILEKVLPRAGGTLVPVEGLDFLPTLPGKEGTVTVCPNELFEGFFLAVIKK